MSSFQGTFCSWWLLMNSDTRWASRTPATLARWCTPRTATGTLNHLFCPTMTSVEFRLSMVRTCFRRNEYQSMKCNFTNNVSINVCLKISPGPNTGVNPDKPDPAPPITPNACDPSVVLDAVTTLRGERIFFKDRYAKNAFSNLNSPWVSWWSGSCPCD